MGTYYEHCYMYKVWQLDGTNQMCPAGCWYLALPYGGHSLVPRLYQSRPNAIKPGNEAKEVSWVARSHS